MGWIRPKNHLTLLSLLGKSRQVLERGEENRLGVLERREDLLLHHECREHHRFALLHVNGPGQPRHQLHGHQGVPWQVRTCIRFNLVSKDLLFKISK